MPNRVLFDYDPHSHLKKELVWSNHDPKNDGWVVTTQPDAIKNKIYELNKLDREAKNNRTEHSLGEIADIPFEDFFQIVRDHPDVFEPQINPITGETNGFTMKLKGRQAKMWWRKLLNRPEHLKHVTNAKVLNKRRG